MKLSIRDSRTLSLGLGLGLGLVVQNDDKHEVRFSIKVRVGLTVSLYLLTV